MSEAEGLRGAPGLQPEGPRGVLLGLLAAALACVEGRRCVREALAGRSWPQPRSVWAAAVGKAASSMMLGAFDALGADLARALVITKDGHVQPQLATLPGVEIWQSAHPVPDQRSLAAGARLLAWVEALPVQGLPLFLISGGASSLVEVLEPGVSFADLTRVNAQGLAAGIGIEELNARRARLSRIKGGRLTALLRGRLALALFLSDVPGDDPAVIGSGVLGPVPDGRDGVERAVVGSIDQALAGAAAAARAQGLTARLLPGRFAGEAEEVARRFTQELLLGAAQVVLWGGESTVQLPDVCGRGGRNQHLALAAAAALAGLPDVLLLAAGTDGTDGPTEDAGAVVDGDTAARVAAAGLSVPACLRTADSGTALAAVGGLIRTGPTGTNVGDLLIGLKGPLKAEVAAPPQRGSGQRRVL